jgi:uncharacterized integral membrane protein
MVAYWVVIVVAMVAFLIGFVVMGLFAANNVNELHRQVAALHGRISDMTIAQSRRGK